MEKINKRYASESNHLQNLVVQLNYKTKGLEYVIEELVDYMACTWWLWCTGVARKLWCTIKNFFEATTVLLTDSFLAYLSTSR